MATVYGNDAGHWSGYMSYSVALTDTAATITAAGGIRSNAWGFALDSGVSAELTLTGQSARSGSGGFSSGTGSTVEKQLASATWTVPRTTSAQSLQLGLHVSNASGYMNGDSWAGAWVDVPALDSWKVSYSANGGSGAPSAQTKWRGVALALSGVRPSRAGYAFKGWATSASGAAAYQPGASYAGNAALSLYAAWSLNYQAPTVSITVLRRCTSAGAAAEDGAYARVEASYAARQSGNKVTSLKVEYRAAGASAWTAAQTTAPNAASGTLAATVGGGALAVDTVYEVRVTASDAGGSGSATARLPGRRIPLDFARQGLSIGVGRAASDTADGVDVAMAVRFAGTVSLPAGSVGTAALAGLAATTAKIADLAVTEAKLAAGAVAPAKMKAKENGTVASKPSGVYVGRRGAVGLLIVDMSGLSVAAWGTVALGTLPSGYLPADAVQAFFPMPHSSGSATVFLTVTKAGVATLQNYSGLAVTGAVVHIRQAYILA